MSDDHTRALDYLREALAGDGSEVEPALRHLLNEVLEIARVMRAGRGE